tara:strand:- start:50 stop:196 length:147 start_codon:yes stop_codon:yes gene_type:complete
MKKQGNKSSSGKGDKPRNCFSKTFKDNYNEINWGERKKSKKGRWKKTY